MGRIALVDDSADTLEMFAFILRNEHDVRTFARPTDFLKLFQPNEYDLVVLDILMPDISGFDVLARIRELDSRVPVAAVTGRADSVHREKALKAGFCEYFVKPILSMDYFRTAISNQISGNRAKRHAPSP